MRYLWLLLRKENARLTRCSTTQSTTTHTRPPRHNKERQKGKEEKTNPQSREQTRRRKKKYNVTKYERQPSTVIGFQKEKKKEATEQERKRTCAQSPAHETDNEKRNNKQHT